MHEEDWRHQLDKAHNFVVFLFKSNIFSNNYSVEVFKGDLYIIGIAVSLEEKSTIENYLLNIKDVNKVINFIFLAKGVKYMGNE